MTLTELAMAKPGKTVGHIRHGGIQVIDTDVTRGIVPESSDLAAEDARVYVAIDNMGKADIAIGLEHIHDGEAELGIETPRRDALLADPIFMHHLVVDAMTRSGVRHASLNPAVAAVPKAILPQAGFQPDASGDTYTLSLGV